MRLHLLTLRRFASGNLIVYTAASPPCFLRPSPTLASYYRLRISLQDIQSDPPLGTISFDKDTDDASHSSCHPKPYKIYNVLNHHLYLHIYMELISQHVPWRAVYQPPTSKKEGGMQYKLLHAILSMPGAASPQSCYSSRVQWLVWRTWRHPPSFHQVPRHPTRPYPTTLLGRLLQDTHTWTLTSTGL